MRIDVKRYYMHTSDQSLIGEIVRAVNEHDEALSKATVDPTFQVLRPMDKDMWDAMQQFIKASDHELAVQRKVNEQCLAKLRKVTEIVETQAKTIELVNDTIAKLHQRINDLAEQLESRHTSVSRRLDKLSGVHGA